MAKGCAPSLGKGAKSGSIAKGTKSSSKGMIASPAQMIAKKGK